MIKLTWTIATCMIIVIVSARQETEERLESSVCGQVGFCVKADVPFADCVRLVAGLLEFIG